jgi:predicted ATPase
LKALLMGAGECVIPVGLHMEKRLVAEAITVTHVLGAVIFVAVFVLACRRAPVYSRLLWWALLWAFLWYLPQSPFVFPDYFADHFLILSSWSWALIFAVFVSTLRGRVVPGALAMVYALGLGVLSERAAGAWSDEVLFFERVVKEAPSSERAREELGRLYLDRRRPEAANVFAGLLGAAWSVETPNDVDVLADRVVRSVDPGGRARRAVFFYHAGLAWQQAGRLDMAERAYMAALRMDPMLGSAHNNLGFLFLSKGRLKEAFEHGVAATTLDARDPVAFNNLGVVCAALGEEEAARRHWKQALVLDPVYVSAQRNLEASKELEK